MSTVYSFMHLLGQRLGYLICWVSADRSLLCACQIKSVWAVLQVDVNHCAANLWHWSNVKQIHKSEVSGGIKQASYFWQKPEEIRISCSGVKGKKKITKWKIKMNTLQPRWRQQNERFSLEAVWGITVIVHCPSLIYFNLLVDNL